MAVGLAATHAAKRALVIAPQWIGDAVMTEPLLRRLQARGERLTIGALPWVAPVYRAMPQVAEVIEFPFAHGGLQLRERRRLAQQVDGQFDVAYICPNSLKSALLPFLAGIPERVGYLGEARVGLLTHRLKNPSKGKRPPMVAFYCALSGEADVNADRPQLHIDPAAADAVLQVLGLQRGGYVVMAPGAEFGPAKRWPTRHFAELARQLSLPVVLLGSAKEADLCAEIEQGCQTPGLSSTPPPPILNLAGKTSLAQALAVISATRSMVSNDSGLMHVAAGFGVRQVAVFGSSSPLHTPPLNAAAHVVWLKNDPSYQPPLDCAPCFERVCPLGHTRCLNDIRAARVLAFL
ncbi:lipopolysaccharide heptosyltransferase II [Rhodoferax antarcticus]|uniref:lipopolysaccharide heptosyltransferase II n=1 Tax=Rhodoferax antarcticus ANT.BR TaxID=1111071 RepID=A0A1Q8YFY3_9BURK|nr:lipopolysaccharide heptosyltransferase II [Rhodoferax antarcticus]APW45486.1 lipopolysaccharide heptosyltransferase II [Rhodoferax antarcticus]OLP06936.1 lipopolysaccharide heptosyltransferase II [Rhodoferax antarcticus ANT.BR]